MIFNLHQGRIVEFISCQSIMFSFCMKMFDHTQASRQGRLIRVGKFTACSILTRFSVFRQSSLQPIEKTANIISVTRNWKLQLWSVSKNTQMKFTRQGCMLSFEDRTLLLRESVTVLRSRDVIHRGSASFWCMISVPVSVIIPVLKKKVVLFDPPS